MFSLILQLETLRIAFQPLVPDRDVETQLLHAPLTTHVALPILNSVLFADTALTGIRVVLG